MNRKLNLTLKPLLIKAFAVLMIVAMTDASVAAQTRIRFARGRTNATVSGTVAAGGERSYILRASAGQTMTVRVSSRSGNVSVDIGGNDVGRGTTIELRSTDEYIITVHNDGGARAAFSLYVAVR